MREREQLFADQPDDEVVVVAVEAVARKPDIVGVISGAVRHPDLPVLGEDIALLLLRQLGERTVATEWIPDGPGPITIRDRPPRTFQQSVPEIRLIPERVRPAEHRVV